MIIKFSSFRILLSRGIFFAIWTSPFLPTESSPFLAFPLVLNCAYQRHCWKTLLYSTDRGGVSCEWSLSPANGRPSIKNFAQQPRGWFTTRLQTGLVLEGGYALIDLLRGTASKVVGVFCTCNFQQAVEAVTFESAWSVAFVNQTCAWSCLLALFSLAIISTVFTQFRMNSSP